MEWKIPAGTAVLNCTDTCQTSICDIKLDKLNVCSKATKPDVCGKSKYSCKEELFVSVPMPFL